MTWIRRHALVLLWFAFSLLLKHLGMIQAPDGANLDSYLATRGDPAHAALDTTRLVLIDEKAFTDPGLFDRRVPLKEEVVIKLLNAIEKGQPALIVVDLDTSATAYQALQKRLSADTHIVWARDVQQDVTPASPSLSGFWGTRTRSVEPLPYLGGRSSATDHNWSAGLAVIPIDRDAVVRRYFRYLLTGSGLQESLGFMALTRFCSLPDAARFAATCGRIASCEAKRCDAAVLLKFNPGSMHPKTLLSGDVFELSQSPAWQPKDVFKGKIVVVGGSHRAARDTFATPVSGEAAGAEIWAQIISAELDGEVLESWHPAAVWILELVVLALLSVFGDFLKGQQFSNWATLGLLAVSVILASTILSFIVFQTIAGLGSFLITMMAVFLDTQHEHAKAGLIQPHAD